MKKAIDKPKRKYTRRTVFGLPSVPGNPEKTEVAPGVPMVSSGGPLVAVNAENLIARAIDKGLPLEQMERLLAMRMQLKQEWAREQYFAALSKFQAQCPNIIKEKAVADKSGKIRYHYAPLDVIVMAVKDALDRNGFSYTVTTKQDDKQVTAECHSHHVEGHSEVSAFTIPMDPAAYMNESQKIASAMTYAKRYAFCNAFGIMTSDADDDANSTNGKLTPAHPEQVYDVGGGAREPKSVTPDNSVRQDQPSAVPVSMENWRWLEVGKPPQSYWAKKGDRAAQQLALFAEFGPAEEYKVEKTEAGWKAYRRISPEGELDAIANKAWTPEVETP
jgi:hypothetical protein